MKINKFNVLITAASRRIALVRSFKKSLKTSGGKLISVDYDLLSPALFFSDLKFKVPLVKKKNYLSEIRRICLENQVKLIIPTIDDELPIWADNYEDFLKDGINVSISPASTIHFFNDKWESYKFFKNNNLPFPESYRKTDKISNNIEYPLFIKPRQGRGSINSFQVKSPRELKFFLDYVPDPIIQRYLHGKEFTVDCFFANSGELISYIPRYRLVIRSGVSDRGLTFDNSDLLKYIQRIGKLTKFRGAVNIQGKIYQNRISFFEINPRFSGGIQLSITAGPNFADLLIRETSGEKLKAQLGNFEKGLLMTSYEDSLFLLRGQIFP
jgi:carbamoyl-phosphate synthase large subunit